ncbi:MAG: TonB-dependent receptor, partial [Sphingosinicella sp.]
MRSIAALLLFASPAALIAQPASPPQPAPAEAGEPAPPPAAGQAAPAPDAEDSLDPLAEEPIVVTGQKPPGSVVGDIQPEQQLGPREIRAH